jgi:hypothetical protein
MMVDVTDAEVRAWAMLRPFMPAGAIKVGVAVDCRRYDQQQRDRLLAEFEAIVQKAKLQARRSCDTACLAEATEDDKARHDHDVAVAAALAAWFGTISEWSVP